MGDIIPVEVTPELCVINAITQRYYTGHPKSTGGVEVDYVAMAYAFSEINLLPEQYPNIEPVLNFPLIGAGLAKGDWDIIASIIDDFCPNFRRVLWIYDT